MLIGEEKCIANRKHIYLFTVSLLKLNSNEGLKAIARNHGHRILLYKEVIIMSLPSHHKTFIWNKTDGLKDLIGYSKEGNLDGKPSTLRNVSAN